MALQRLQIDRHPQPSARGTWTWEYQQRLRRVMECLEAARGKRAASQSHRTENSVVRGEW